MNADEEIERLVAEALERHDDGEHVSLPELCRDRPDLLARVAAALDRSHELEGLHSAAGRLDPFADRVLAGRYELHERLGAGAMGVVHRAVDRELRRDVAVKLLRTELLDGDEAIARFTREAEVLAAVQHPSVVQVYDRGNDEDTAFLVMELVGGVPLSELLDEASTAAAGDDSSAWMRRHFDDDAPLDPSMLRQFVRWVAQLADGLHVAHTAGIYHRDIKPSNVRLRRDGTPVLLDFGIAARSAEATLGARETPIGTPAYLDPNLLAGGPVGAPVDVYGLAATLYSMLTLRPPYRGTPQQVLARMPRHEPPPLDRLRPGLPRDLRAVVDHGMSRHEGERYRSLRPFADDLRAFLAFQPVSVRPIGSARRLLRRAVASPVVRTIAAVALLLVAGVVIANHLRAEQDRDQTRWRQLWATIPPALLDAPARMRAIADAEARAAIAARLDELVGLDVEPLAPLLVRGLFRLDNGDRHGARADLTRFAELADDPTASAFVRTELEPAGDGPEALQLPAEASWIAAYVVGMRNARLVAEGRALDEQVQPLLASGPQPARELGLRIRQGDLMTRVRQDGDRHLLQQHQSDILRLEVECGRTATTAMAMFIVDALMARRPEALERLQEAIALAPESHSVLINLGTALAQSGDLAGARQAYARAIELRPFSFGARRALVDTLLSVDDFDAAERVLQQTRENPDVATPGEVDELTGNYWCGVAQYRQMLGDEAGRLEAAQRAVEAYESGSAHGNGRCERALPTARRLTVGLESLWLDDARRAREAPLEWQRIELMMRTLPERLDAEQTEALRDYLIALRKAAAPHLR